MIALRQRPLLTPETTQSIWRPLPFVQGVSELIARHLRPYNLIISPESTDSREFMILFINKANFPFLQGPPSHAETAKCLV